ncbi:MAG: aldo/keto reductase family protein [Culicoidibacterales bacterium]
MKYRQVGHSGLRVSEITLGSWLTYGKSVADNTAEQIIARAIELGINSFDCADVYELGAAERVLGKSLAPYTRSDFVISTKVFWPMSANINDRGLSRKHIMESIDKSLERLQMNYVDIYYCHRYDQSTPLEETLEALNDIIRIGKALYVGVSMWSGDQLLHAKEIITRRGFSQIIVNQPPYNLINRDIEAYDMPVSSRLGIGQMVYSPLAQGILTGKYNTGIPSDSRMANPAISGTMKDDFTNKIALARQYQVIADSLEIPLAQLSLSWILSHKEVASCIIGATSVQQLEENVLGIHFTCTPGILEQLNKVFNHHSAI